MDERVKEIMEKAKLTAAMAAGVATQAAEVVSKKGGRLVELTKLKVQVLDLNNEVELLMRDAGRILYLAHTGAETCEADIDEKLEQIDAKYARIAELKQEITARKTTVTCPVCGKECDKDDLFCSVCGEKL